MENRIRRIELLDRSLDPVSAEVWISVLPERQTAATEVRGRLMGPRCPYSSTVEVAYPLRRLAPDQQPIEPAGLTVRVLIPEASLWEPQCPFLYHGPVELWQDGRCCDRALISHGLRTLQWNERRLCVNGRPLTLRGRQVAAWSEEEAFALRQAGYNLLVAPVAETTLSLWEMADRLGFFMLGQVRMDDAETVRFLQQLSRHASCLGWLIDDRAHPPLDRFPSGGLLGLAGDSVSSADLLKKAHFLVGPLELANRGKPLLVKGEVPISSSEGCLILGSVV